MNIKRVQNRKLKFKSIFRNFQSYSDMLLSEVHVYVLCVHCISAHPILSTVDLFEICDD